MGLQVQKTYNLHRTTENGLVYCKAWRVVADAAADILAETAALIAGSNEVLVS